MAKVGEGKGASYVARDGAAKTYRAAARRARALKCRNWLHYQELAREHGLPTQPQTLWPDEWEAGGRFAGYLGLGASEESLRTQGMVSAAEARGRLGIGHAAWKALSADIAPDGSVRHKLYYDPANLVPALAERIDRIKRIDARTALAASLEAWRGDF